MPRAEHMFYSGGGVPAEKRGRGGRCRRGIRVSLAEMPATRSKASGALETGEGELVPPPRRPHPPWRYPHGPVHGESPEKSRIRLLTSSTPGTAAHQLHPGHGCSPDIATHGPRPQEGAGEERRRRGRGGGCRQKRMSIPCRRRGRGGGRRQRCMGSLLAKARVRWGSPAEVYGYPLPKARAG